MATTLEFATELAVRAGKVLMEHFRPIGRAAIVDRKSAQVRNIVTAADTASEELIKAEIRATYPEHAIAAEESGRGGAESDHVWHVDPLDGTINFAHAHPFFAVSIGLAVAGRPVLGAVHAPRLGETFTGEVGKGAWLDGEPIRVSETDALIESILGTGFPYDRNESPNHNVDNFSRLVLLAGGVRRAGAAAIDLAYVAAGRLDGFWELGLSSWDVAAGAAIVTAAGGTVTDFTGGDGFVEGRNVVASNGRIHEAIRERLSPVR
jgi:myo-inositol-1(or 4)-monophosphatase